jgi:choline dehydrogenase-like flavoprotein
MSVERTQVLVIGSGAGGSVTALELASRGFEVLVLEEGPRFTLEDYGQGSRVAMERIYRRRGMTPILGSTPIGYVEGRCVGGSTEVNSGFWHRTPPEILLRWKARYDLAHCSPEELAPHFEWAEERVHVGLSPGAWPAGTKAFARGIEAMGWSSQEVPRSASGCVNTNTCAMGCPKGAKQGMSRSLVPQAEKAGARFRTGCRVRRLIVEGGRVRGVTASVEQPDGTRVTERMEAEAVFVCAGPTETPSLLRRSGIRGRIGNSLRIHPMLKMAARFPETIDAHRSVLPLLQVKEFWPEISLGGAFFTPGHLAMALSENWPSTRDRMRDYRRMAIFYVAVRGTARGRVRPALLDEDASTIHYNLSQEDRTNLSKGVGRLATLLLAAGADEVYPGVYGLPAIRSDVEAVRWLDEELPASRLALTTVHAFSTCPIGERADRCGANSFGKVHDFENLYVNDASILPDSPGVNPQGSIMGFARRNAIHFAEAGR